MKAYYKDTIKNNAKHLVTCLDDKLLKHKLGIEAYNEIKRVLFSIAADKYKEEGNMPNAEIFETQAQRYKLPNAYEETIEEKTERFKKRLGMI